MPGRAPHCAGMDDNIMLREPGGESRRGAVGDIPAKLGGSRLDNKKDE